VFSPVSFIQIVMRAPRFGPRNESNRGFSDHSSTVSNSAGRMISSSSQSSE
jgi:hypothetical protein